LKSLDVGAIFKEDKNHWEKGMLSSRYDGFVKGFVDNGTPKSNQMVNTTKEKFLAHVYNGITIAQKFDK
jgi:hypothetical protein